MLKIIIKFYPPIWHKFCILEISLHLFSPAVIPLLRGFGMKDEKRTVLIVDDEVRSLETLQRILEDEFNVRTAENVEQARRILEREWVQIILCDQRMPEITGVEFLKQVREQVPTRICVGERLHTRFEFIPIFENHLADFIMPDVTWTGGISELKKIATLAEAYYIPITPHDASGPINVMAGAHVMMTVPNFYRLETSLVRVETYDTFLKTPLDIQDGVLHVSDRPGLGIEFDLDFFKTNAAPGWGG